MAKTIIPIPWIMPIVTIAASNGFSHVCGLIVCRVASRDTLNYASREWKVKESFTDSRKMPAIPVVPIVAIFRIVPNLTD